jgi:hypothetical protein
MVDCGQNRVGPPVTLKKRRKTHQKFLYLLLRHRRMDRFQFHHILRRIIVSRKMFIGDMQLMALRIRLHRILLRKPIDHGHRLLLVGDGNALYFVCHVMNAANPGPKTGPAPNAAAHLDVPGRGLAAHQGKVLSGIYC